MSCSITSIILSSIWSNTRIASHCSSASTDSSSAGLPNGRSPAPPPNRTPLRLRDTTALGWLSADESQGLVEAFELMWQVRLEHQSRRIERGLTPDDLVEPRELGPLTRQALKEAFRMIDRAQDRLAALLGIRR